ncbi:MAG: hypothetical protein ACK4GG_11135 [Sphingomonas sp.]
MTDSPTPPTASDEDETNLAVTPAPNCSRADGWTTRRRPLRQAAENHRDSVKLV